MAFSHILFDLDGTLTDPALGITNSVMYALERFGIHVKDRRELYPFIGPPLVDSFMEYYHLSRADARKGVAYYREYYADKGIFECSVYDGIPQLLQRLQSQKKSLILATSKPEHFATLVLEHFHLDPYFSRIAGASLDESRTTKDAVIDWALRDITFTPGCAAMVGDRRYDMEGAKKFGLFAVGVLFGYGSQQELENAGADKLAVDAEELFSILSPGCKVK